MTQRSLFTALLVLAVLTLPTIAFAYVGPGAGLSAIGTVLALIGAVLLGIVGFVWYPIKRLLRGKQVEEIKGEDETPDDIMSPAEKVDAEPRQ